MAVDAGGRRFPAELRRARRAAGLSYRALADRCGLSHSFLSHLEKGERGPPRLDRVVELAVALDVSPRGLVLSALADRVGVEVAHLAVALLRRQPNGGSEAGGSAGLVIESGNAGRVRDLQATALTDDGARTLQAQLYFVDLQFDADILRVAFKDQTSADAMVLALVGPRTENTAE